MSPFRSALSRTRLLNSKGIRAVLSLHTTPARREHFLDISPEAFKHHIGQNDRLILVDFYANWCGPCKTISPLLEKLTNELTTKDGKPIDLITVDTDSDENISLVASHKIRSLPTIIAFKNGKPVDQFVGAIPEEAIKEFIARH